jgi:endonuclease YncB( thermonuclease family)
MKALFVQTPAMASKGLLVVWASLALAWPADAAAQAITATVLSIGDGDTIRVRQSGRVISVRLACIDAPESAQGPYGQQAHRYLQRRLVLGRTVTLHVKTTDRYGRLVAEVFSGVNINLAMVEDGQAFAYRQYLGSCNARDFLEAETRARRRRLGVWQMEGGITRPWEFRRGRKAAAMGRPANLCADWVSAGHLRGTATGTPAGHSGPERAVR